MDCTFVNNWKSYQLAYNGEEAKCFRLIEFTVFKIKGSPITDIRISLLGFSIEMTLAL